MERKKKEIKANQTRSAKTRKARHIAGRKRHRPVLVSKVYAFEARIEETTANRPKR